MKITITTSIAALLLAQAANASFLKAGGNTFTDGVAAGQEEAESLWSQQGGDCASIWSFQNTVDDVVASMYPDSGNWKTRSYNRGARAGASQVVEKYEKKCLDDSPDECNDLGLAAAAEIAYEFCPISVDYAADQAVYDYKKACRLVAYGICKGSIGEAVKANGCSLTTTQTLELQSKCQDQVDSMTDESNSVTLTDDNDITIIVDDDDADNAVITVDDAFDDAVISADDEISADDTIFSADDDADNVIITIDDNIFSADDNNAVVNADDDADNVIITIDDATTSVCEEKNSCDTCLGNGCAWVEGDGLGSGKCFDDCNADFSKGFWMCYDGTVVTPADVCPRDDDNAVVNADDDAENVIITIDDATTYPSCEENSSCDTCLGSGCAWVEGDGLGSGKCFDDCNQASYSKGFWICYDGTLVTPEDVCSREMQ